MKLISWISSEFATLSGLELGRALDAMKLSQSEMMGNFTAPTLDVAGAREMHESSLTGLWQILDRIQALIAVFAIQLAALTLIAFQTNFNDLYLRIDAYRLEATVIACCYYGFAILSFLLAFRGLMLCIREVPAQRVNYPDLVETYRPANPRPPLCSWVLRWFSWDGEQGDASPNKALVREYVLCSELNGLEGVRANNSLWTACLFMRESLKCTLTSAAAYFGLLALSIVAR